MPSTFFGLSIAQTGLNAFQVATNNAANNISNVDTEGFSRQQVNLKAGQAIRTYQKYGNSGTGVVADSITQVRDRYYDEKYWNNNASYGLYDKKYYYMQQIENYFKDNSAVPGFTTIYTKMFNALNAMSSNAGETSVRNEFISDAKELTGYFNDISSKLTNLQTMVNDEIKTTVDQVNSIAKKISMMNRQINVIELQGGHANELRDQRALLVDELSQILPVDVEEDKVVNSNYPDMYTGATDYYVRINGKTLVNNFEYNELTTVTRTNRYAQSDVPGLYDVAWEDTGEILAVNSKSMKGSLQAMFQIRDGSNGENLKGSVTKVTSDSISISYPNSTDPLAMNLPVEGTFTVDNTKYNYSGFDVTRDKDGKILSYTLKGVTPAINASESGKILGNTLTVGETIDYKGIVYYQNQMNQFLRAFTQAFNDIEETGRDLNGDRAGAFFVANDTVNGGELKFNDEKKDHNVKTVTDADGNTTTEAEQFTYSFSTDSAENADAYYNLTAANISVAKSMQQSPAKFGASTYDPARLDKGVESSDVVKQLLELQSNTKIFRDGGGDDFLETIYSDITVDTQECKVFQDNYKSIQDSIDTQRKSVSGVDEDDEALDLVKFQNAYNLASKAIQVLSEMYDRLITQTGV